MPKILIVSATTDEIAPTLQAKNISVKPGMGLFSGPVADLFVLITGAGMVNTAFEMGKLIGSHFDLAINAGLAGSFTRFRTGDVLNVTRDCFSELGAEDDAEFISFDTLGFGRQHIEALHPFENTFSARLPKTNGITVNTVHGNEGSIAKVIEKYQPHTESMEGAAFLHASNDFNWKCIQLRAVSNLVTRRDKNAWNIPLAIENLNRALLGLLDSVSGQLPDLKND